MTIQLVDISKEMTDSWRRHFHDCDVTIFNGDLFSLKTDCVVSPSNSFGFMDGGVDRIIMRRFGPQLQERIKRKISLLPTGELLVGDSVILDTRDNEIPYCIFAPTMRVPSDIRNTVNGYLSAKAIFSCIANQCCEIKAITIPGLGTGVGRLSFDSCAVQMRAAYDEIILLKKIDLSWRSVMETNSRLLGTSIYFN